MSTSIFVDIEMKCNKSDTKKFIFNRKIRVYKELTIFQISFLNIKIYIIFLKGKASIL